MHYTVLTRCLGLDRSSTLHVSRVTYVLRGGQSVGNSGLEVETKSVLIPLAFKGNGNDGGAWRSIAGYHVSSSGFL